MKIAKNVAASIRHRLLIRSKQEIRPFNEVLQYYAMERFLYRLSNSTLANQYILKGALMLKVWSAPDTRPTMDIDLLGKTSNEIENIRRQMQTILSANVVADGLNFMVETMQLEPITEEADYHGVRVSFLGYLDTAKINMQIDIGIGDIVYPAPIQAKLPTILDLPAPEILIYSLESAIAEKFEAIVKLGLVNSRMKDFYDIWMLSRQFDFDWITLMTAIKLTFERRGTKIPSEIVAFSDSFIDDKQVQWAAFRKRLKQDHVPNEFKTIVSLLIVFFSSINIELSIILVMKFLIIENMFPILQSPLAIMFFII